MIIIYLYAFPGGDYNSEKSGALCPLFLGYFEDTHFKAPHYQSVVPMRNSNVLRTIKSNDGFDVAMEFGFPETTTSTGQINTL